MIRISSERGFTLIELIIAVVGLSILAMVVVPKMASAHDQAKVAACKQNQQLITCACSFYYATHHLDPNSNNAGSFPNALSELIPDYLEKIPECPGGGTYIYGAATGIVTCSEISHARY